MREMNRFGADNRGTKACEFCGVLSWASRQDDTANRAMCQGCFDAAGWENSHQDTDGEHYGTGFVRECPVCNPAGEERRLARAAQRVAGYGAAAAARAEKAQAREAAAAAKEAAIKRCADTDWRGQPCDSRASASSAYCSIHRGDHPHAWKLMPKADREHVARMLRNNDRPALADIDTLCALCPNDKNDAIHKETNQ